MESFVPDRLRVSETSRHPKIHATVRRAVELWQRGEKVLVFCTYRQTARALRDHIGQAIDDAVVDLVIQKAGLQPRTKVEGVREARRLLERMARRLSDPAGRLHAELGAFLRTMLERPEFHDLTAYQGPLLRLLLGYVRSHSFIARYLPLGPQMDDAAAGVAALSEAIGRTTDLSGTTLHGRLEEFLRFAVELAARSRAAASLDDEEDDAHDALTHYFESVAVSTRARNAAREEGITERSGSSYRALQTVRMVFGQTPRDVRERVMAGFNSPLFPEVLISSEVLAEGVDLHRFCRVIIHHDLSWNPSVIEQRTGRLDRIRCRAETARRPILVYLPYIAESADEKLYRVVRDRERWFQVVMGQRFTFDERTADQIAERVLLPPDLAAKLLFDLRRYVPQIICSDGPPSSEIASQDGCSPPTDA